ncbi:hypothetical protein EV177_001723 [Coemansia sp. RSA 1804]|nr:hypothetical protein EV177_001723 [Coemansia sp. RSA 1804]
MAAERSGATSCQSPNPSAAMSLFLPIGSAGSGTFGWSDIGGRGTLGTPFTLVAGCFEARCGNEEDEDDERVLEATLVDVVEKDEEEEEEEELEYAVAVAGLLRRSTLIDPFIAKNRRSLRLRLNASFASMRRKWL